MIHHLWGQRRAFGNWARHGDDARSPRARAAQRRAVLNAVRMGAKALVGIAAFDALVLPVLHPSGTPAFLVASGALGVGGLLALTELPRFRRRPELIAFLLALLAGLTARVVARAVPEAATLMTSYLLLLPGALAILVPWRTLTHLRWIGIYGITSIVFMIGPLARGVPPGEGRDQVVAVVLAIAFSLLGHLLAQRSRLRYGAQLERGRVLRHETIRQRAEIGHLYAELLKAARFDPLTRVGNRLLLDEDLRALASRLSRSGGSAWVLAVDVDDFKQVNDELGHDAGDRVLAAVAQAMRAQLRASDSIYRYGGDEFVFLLADASEREVRALAERLRGAVEMCRFDGLPERITISLGAAPADVEALESTDGRWFRRADEALYRVKATGRNGMMIASAPSAPQRVRRGRRGWSRTPRAADADPAQPLAHVG
jgi:diguanylate cyclase (GGDEF)-like protein